MRLPIMIHIGDTASPLPQILALLRPGDIVTHMYAPTPHGIFDAQGGILPEVRRARRRGILFDFGNGRTEHWKWETAESGLRQGFPPDTISSDLDLPGRSEGVLDLPNVLSKFLLLGMPLTQVIACATRNAARAIRGWNALGTLRPGASSRHRRARPGSRELRFRGQLQEPARGLAKADCLTRRSRVAGS